MAMSEDSGEGGILGVAGDLLDSVTTAAAEAGGAVLDLGNDFLHEGAAVGDGVRAAGDAVTGDGNAATHELKNLVADGFEALPGHELAWDGLAELGHAIDGPQSDAKVWGDGGANQFREGVGADPEHEAQPFQLPGEPEIQEA
jgi:hypothetical protein